MYLFIGMISGMLFMYVRQCVRSPTVWHDDVMMSCLANCRALVGTRVMTFSYTTAKTLIYISVSLGIQELHSFLCTNKSQETPTQNSKTNIHHETKEQNNINKNIPLHPPIDTKPW
jgi:hypothetical protein